MTEPDVCAHCGGDVFRVAEGALACAACGRNRPLPDEAGLAELRREVRTMREEIARLRRAVNFLNQRVR